jgi:hypothetical protein
VEGEKEHQKRGFLGTQKAVCRGKCQRSVEWIGPLSLIFEKITLALKSEDLIRMTMNRICRRCRVGNQPRCAIPTQQLPMPMLNKPFHPRNYKEVMDPQISAMFLKIPVTTAEVFGHARFTGAPMVRLPDQIHFSMMQVNLFFSQKT